MCRSRAVHGPDMHASMHSAGFHDAARGFVSGRLIECQLSPAVHASTLGADELEMPSCRDEVLIVLIAHGFACFRAVDSPVLRLLSSVMAWLFTALRY